MYRVCLKHEGKNNVFFSVYDDTGLLRQEPFRGRTFHDFFKKRGEDWIVFGSDGSPGLRFFNLTTKSHVDTRSFNFGGYAGSVCAVVNPTGDYIAVMRSGSFIDIMDIRELGKRHAIRLMWVYNDTNREYNSLFKHQEFRKSRLVWTSKRRFIFRSAMYELIYDIHKEADDIFIQGFTEGLATLTLGEVTLFSLLSNKFDIDQ